MSSSEETFPGAAVCLAIELPNGKSGSPPGRWASLTLFFNLRPFVAGRAVALAKADLFAVALFGLW